MFLVTASIIVLLQQKDNLEALEIRFQADYSDRTTVFCQSGDLFACTNFFYKYIH